MDDQIFLDLVNDVLKRVGREPLPDGGPGQRIISVRSSDRVLQILAGPGSGKTEMLIWRVLYELFVGGTPSDRVMVTTFTRRAATELQVRVVERSDALLDAAKKKRIPASDPFVHDLRIGTIHSLCDSLLAEFDAQYADDGTQLIDETETSARIARDYRWALGFQNPPGAKRVLNRIFENSDLMGLFKAPWEDSPNWPSSTMDRVACIMALTSQHIETWIPRSDGGKKLNGLDALHNTTTVTEDLIKLQTRWEEYLKQNKLLDFATVQKRFLERQHIVQGLLSHIFVDEFQDNNPIQFAIHTGWLVKSDLKLTVVGDDDQAIYRFRGSDIECFNQLEPFCTAKKIPYRQEKLETNFRSTKNIVWFTQRFRRETVLQRVSMRKSIIPDETAPQGPPVRLVEGPWDDICAFVAHELKSAGAGRIPKDGEGISTAAVLAFSTSERGRRGHASPAVSLRSAIESVGVRVYNPRNKTAATSESPVSQLLGLISYLFDPISLAPAGRNGRLVMVAATYRDERSPFAAAKAPDFPINQSHLEFQKKFVKGGNGTIGRAVPERQAVLDFVDKIRGALLERCKSGRKPRLTMAGFVARMLCLPFFRGCGFTINLFRQALFTQLLEANIAATRMSRQSLDEPLEVSQADGKFAWPERFWTFLNLFGAFLDSATLDDLEVETFEQDAVLMLTFHQGKGLEFNQVFVAGSGRPIDIAPALRTTLFSGEAVRFQIDPDDLLTTRNQKVLQLAEADRDREVYVAMTRAKETLTILHDPSATLPYMALNPAVASIFKSIPGSKSRDYPSLTIKEWNADE